ncbi:hypothetical protein ACS0TY_011570 [Phlomoides rotata]
MKRKGKKKTAEDEEELISNDWCFVCKEGGDTMRICDRKQCGKPYHPRCVQKDDSFLKKNDHWVCDWHTCFRCHRYSYCHCYTCPNSVCRRCLPAEDFAQVKGKYGFCDECLELAVLIERKEDIHNSDGEKVDFTDQDTVEGLFKEYYDIIKKERGIEARDVYAADESLKTKSEHQSESSSEEYNEEYDEEEDQISDYDGSEHAKKIKRICKEKRSEREKSTKNMFIGWASRSLIEFLTSIGKSTNEKLSQDDVTSIINEYVKEHKLLHQEKRNRVICDARLWSVFRRRTVNRCRVYELLEAHFAENHDESEQDELEYDSEDENAGIPCGRQRKLDSENKSSKMELEDSARLSCFASIIVENIKLVYLRKSLLGKLLEQPESFEEKVIGSYVRVKSVPYDRSKISYQLVQVEGVKRNSSGENNMQVVLQVSATPRDITIDQLSDADFFEEECEDLRQKMVSGQLKRPTVGDLQQKAKILHEDITNDLIKRELVVLEKCIDQANEKGWRHKYPSMSCYIMGYILDCISLIPDVHELQLDSNSGDITNGMNSDKGSPQSILQYNSSVPKNGWQDNKAYDHKFKDLESEKWCILGPDGEREDKCSLSALKGWSDRSPYAFKFKVWREDENEKKAISMQEAMSHAFPEK